MDEPEYQLTKKESTFQHLFNIEEELINNYSCTLDRKIPYSVCCSIESFYNDEKGKLYLTSNLESVSFSLEIVLWWKV